MENDLFTGQEINGQEVNPRHDELITDWAVYRRYSQSGNKSVPGRK